MNVTFKLVDPNADETIIAEKIYDIYDSRDANAVLRSVKDLVMIGGLGDDLSKYAILNNGKEISGEIGVYSLINPFIPPDSFEIVTDGELPQYHFVSIIHLPERDRREVPVVEADEIHNDHEGIINIINMAPIGDDEGRDREDRINMAPVGDDEGDGDWVPGNAHGGGLSQYKRKKYRGRLKSRRSKRSKRTNKKRTNKKRTNKKRTKRRRR